MMLDEAHLLRLINDAYEDGTGCETLADAYTIDEGDGLATFVVRECAEVSETHDGMYDPEEAALAMRSAAESLESIADALDRMASAEVVDGSYYG